jgi:hypothetical protein
MIMTAFLKVNKVMIQRCLQSQKKSANDKIHDSFKHTTTDIFLSYSIIKFLFIYFINRVNISIFLST